MDRLALSFIVGVVVGIIFTSLWATSSCRRCASEQKDRKQPRNPNGKAGKGKFKSSQEWAKLSKSEYRREDDEIECDDIPKTDLGFNKLVLAVRKDLEMGKGKVAAQCSHAAVLAYELCRKKCPHIFENWKRNGQMKVVVKIDSEEEMLKLAEEAKNNEILVSIVQDAGRTQVAPGSRTVLAIGPGPEGLIDQVTGHLKLY